ncbi:MAG TPA: helix-turn-helix transcriptional regulator [Thermoanaerobaculia bacterium]|jgi:transcriptional regulator with XRE-family HTH domain|nr:helix-turn-helix transcriptional regulator [Thermoanaerobaculia bacterium]
MRPNRGNEGQIFGERLRAVRLAKGLTQSDLADLCGTSIAAISHIERGTKVPTLTTLVRLADALQCKVTKLVEVLDRKSRLSR